MHIYSLKIRTLACTHAQLAALSAAWGCPYFGWMHSDGVVMVKPQPQDGSMTSMGPIVEAQIQQLRSWGVAFTYYDVLAFFNTEVWHLLLQ